MAVHPKQISTYEHLPSDKKLYFASDFHLGVPDKEQSTHREKKVIRWLEYVARDASAIFLVGDVFDFWFEYQTVIPKYFLRFQAKLAELSDRGIDIHLFTGNHDLWMNEYFSQELGVAIHKDPIRLSVHSKHLFIGHGDGLGPGDRVFKFIKRIFTNPLAKWLFRWLHPDVGVRLAQSWSRKSRASKTDESFQGEEERLWTFSKQMETKVHHDYYIFGHRHLSLELPVGNNSMYVNLGEWITGNRYLVFDGEHATLESFEN